jgi:hypothetical protein
MCTKEQQLDIILQTDEGRRGRRRGRTEIRGRQTDRTDTEQRQTDTTRQTDRHNKTDRQREPRAEESKFQGSTATSRASVEAAAIPNPISVDRRWSIDYSTHWQRVA